MVDLSYDSKSPFTTISLLFDLAAAGIAADRMIKTVNRIINVLFMMRSLSLLFDVFELLFLIF